MKETGQNAMATMAQAMLQAVDGLTGVAKQQQTTSDQVVALLKVAAPKRAVRDASGKIVGPRHS